MRKVLFGVIATVFVLSGCGGNEYTAAPEGSVPEYNVATEREGGRDGLLIVNAVVDTEASSAEDLRLISQEIRSENAGADVLFATFSDSSLEGGQGNAGSAVAANSEDAAEQIFTPEILTSFMSDKTPQEIMAEDDGMIVVSTRDGTDSFAEEVCAGESDPEMRTVMDCPEN